MAEVFTAPAGRPSNCTRLTRIWKEGEIQGKIGKQRGTKGKEETGRGQRKRNRGKRRGRKGDEAAWHVQGWGAGKMMHLKKKLNIPKQSVRFEKIQQ